MNEIGLKIRRTAPTRLSQAIAEFGRIDKTLHTLTCIVVLNMIVLSSSEVLELRRAWQIQRMFRASVRGPAKALQAG
jgi:hypothetical protein